MKIAIAAVGHWQPSSFVPSCEHFPKSTKFGNVDDNTNMATPTQVFLVSRLRTLHFADSITITWLNLHFTFDANEIWMKEVKNFLTQFTKMIWQKKIRNSHNISSIDNC